MSTLKCESPTTTGTNLVQASRPEPAPLEGRTREWERLAVQSGASLRGAGILAKWLAWRTDIEEAAPVGRGGNRKAALREARRNVGPGVPLVAERLRDTCGMEDALVRIAASKRGGKVNLGPLVRPDLRRGGEVVPASRSRPLTTAAGPRSHRRTTA